MSAEEQLKKHKDYIDFRISALRNERSSIMYSHEHYGATKKDDRLREIDIQISTFNEMYYMVKPIKK